MRTPLKITTALFAFLAAVSAVGVSASFFYADADPEAQAKTVGVELNAFIYTPEDMRPEEVTAVQRLADILNRNYKTDKVQDSLEFLLKETIQVYWNGDKSQDPYVGSMDDTYTEEINALFEDVLFETGVKFILKNQDLNGDGRNEIAMYSTIDTLNNTGADYEGVVCVYVTVFTPIVASGQIVGYTQVCESVRGYCYEIYYSPTNHEPSFSTDTWLDSVGFTDRWNRTQELPETAKMDYNSYNLSYRSGSRYYTTKPIGNTLSQVLADEF